jgi:hypothetical protein
VIAGLFIIRLSRHCCQISPYELGNHRHRWLNSKLCEVGVEILPPCASGINGVMEIQDVVPQGKYSITNSSLV